LPSDVRFLRPKCTKYDFDWGSPDPARGAYRVLLEPLAVFKGPTAKGGRGEEGK